MMANLRTMYYFIPLSININESYKKNTLHGTKNLTNGTPFFGMDGLLMLQRIYPSKKFGKIFAFQNLKKIIILSNITNHTRKGNCPKTSLQGL